MRNVILSVSEESIWCRLHTRDPSLEFILSKIEGPQDDIANKNEALIRFERLEDFEPVFIRSYQLS